jgi:hypothetical protein
LIKKVENFLFFGIEKSIERSSENWLLGTLLFFVLIVLGKIKKKEKNSSKFFLLSLSNNFDVNWKSKQHFFCLTCCTGTSVIYIRIYVSKSSIKILFFSNQKVFFSNQLLNEHPEKINQFPSNKWPN